MGYGGDGGGGDSSVNALYGMHSCAILIHCPDTFKQVTVNSISYSMF